VAEVDLDLVKLDRALIVLDRPLVLLDNLFLIVQGLLGNGVSRPRGLVAGEVHLRLRQYPLVPLQNPLGLQQRGSERARIDLDQRVALAHHLALREMHRGHDSIDLAGDRGGVDRGDGPYGVQIDADIPLLRRSRGECDGACSGAPAPAAGGRRDGLVVPQNKKKSCGEKNQEENPYADTNPSLLGPFSGCG